MLNRISIASLLAALSAFAQDRSATSQYIDRGIAQLKAGANEDAAAAFQSALDSDPKNLTALRGVAAATFRAAGASRDAIDKERFLDQAAHWNQELIQADPNESDAYYSLGVIAWNQAFPELRKARTSLGMKPDTPAPLTDSSVRQEMRARFETVIETGIQNLQKAIQLDPKHSDAMAYLNLLLRSRADIRDTPEQAAEDVRAANEWVAKSMAEMRASGGMGSSHPLSMGVLAPPPPPPPPPTGSVNSIRVGGNVSAANLITKVDPVYPPLALQARVQGTVKFNVGIGKDGHIANLTLVSGHPLLVAAAQQAIQQWVYKPTLLNGQPVEVITTADVNFTLTP